MSSLVLYVIQITFQPVGKIISYELILAEISSIANLPPPFSFDLVARWVAAFNL